MSLFYGMALFRMTEIEKLKRALEKVIDLFFTDFIGGEQASEIEIWKAPAANPGGQELTQAARINGPQVAYFLENNTMQGIIEDAWVKQFADLRTRAALDQNGAEKAQRVLLKLKPSVFLVHSHLRLSQQ